MPFGEIRSSSGRVLTLAPEGWINNEGVNLNDAPLPANVLAQAAMGQAQSAAQQPAVQQPVGNRLAQVAQGQPSLSDFLVANNTSMKNAVDYNGKQAFRTPDGAIVWQNPDGTTGKATILNPQQAAYDAQQRGIEKDRASIDATRANTERTRLETQQMLTPTKPNWEVVNTDQGTFRLDKQSGKVEPVTMNGQPFNAASAKPLTEQQGNATAFALRAGQALNDLQGLTDDKGQPYAPGAVDRTMAKLPLGIGNFALDPKTQQFMAAEKNYIASVLRKESGAAISQGEYDTYGPMLFPRPGDSKDVLAQKARSRALVEQTLKIQAGPQYDKLAAQALNAPGVHAAGQSSGYADPAKEARYQQWLKAKGR